jgi:hypothetical protein
VRRRRERGVIAHLVERGRELAARTAPVSVPVDHDRLGLRVGMAGGDTGGDTDTESSCELSRR